MPTTKHLPDPEPALRLLAVDGPSLAHRAYHAGEASNARTPDGTPVWTLNGFLRLLAMLVEQTRPNALVIGWDADSDTSHRRAMYPAYKTNRSAKPEYLIRQLADLADLLDSAGFVQIRPDGWEADDVVASAATAANKQPDGRCVVATSDRDAFALISERTSVLRLVNGSQTVLMNAAALLREYQVSATPINRYLQFAALRGDPSDNLTGVTGIGEKTAVQLLAALGSVEEAIADPDATTAAIGASRAAKLAAGYPAWQRNMQVMTPKSDLPVDVATARRLPTGGQLTQVCADRHVRAGKLPELLDQLRITPGSAPATAASSTPLAAHPESGVTAGCTTTRFPASMRDLPRRLPTIPGTTVPGAVTL